ncbi:MULTISPECIES: hypothetical protein [Streptosporangium]|uniref:Uncharacterized protein n=1 Tax=Streptosporangium brasiliense TaxID=47480 RepID=A0ABT9RNR5_9ACTN|nr:hypothetical protein [Streptosporangium brasiliense]MDP9870349.1 hypothetical protein [Streptosporangium brasiliense]
MSLFKRSPDRVRARAAARLARISREQVLDWLDVCLSGAWKAAEDHRKNLQDDELDELEKGLQMALGAVDDLRRRRAGQTTPRT